MSLPAVDADKKFSKLVDKKNSQVFLFCCPGNIPLPFAAHLWFVINNKGTLARWEILFRERVNKTSWGHLHKDFLPPFAGLGVLPYFETHFSYHASLIGYEENQIAEEMAKFIENSPVTYPFLHKFFLTGPNCNTYANWILGQAKNSKLKLPWNAFGKDYPA
jgi:hypothetical protein